MKSVIVGINAKYVHTSLAARALAAYALENGVQDVHVLECTINEPYDHILERIYSARAGAVLLSCYIWNWEVCRRIVRDLRALCPGAKIYLGGPQVSFHAREALRDVPADGVVRGEGEEPARRLLAALAADRDLSGVPSLTWRDGDALRENAAAPPLDLARLPFCYEDPGALPHQILYYESSRGCPYACSYCLSGIERSVRLKPLGQVLRDLDRFLAARVRQVKFCDRTFNCNARHCETIWRYLIGHDNGVTNFHFEVAAEPFTPGQLALLGRARPGLFQLELGVQSTHGPTLAAVNRRSSPGKLAAVCRAIRGMGNVHLHLDLIAGLPLESFERFTRSFDDVYSLAPDQLQLGFLKVLPGSQLEARREDFGIICRCSPPYEVLYTASIAPDELFRLKRAARMVDSFYNCDAFRGRLSGEALGALRIRPYDFYDILAARYAARGYFEAPPSRRALAALLDEFLSDLEASDADQPHV